MLRVSNGVLGVINFLSFLVSIPIVAFGLYLGSRSATECMRMMQPPFFIFGVFLLVVSLFGIIGSCCRSYSIMWVYLFLMFTLILALFCLSVFSIVLTRKARGAHTGYLEDKIGGYSGWLQRVASEDRHWIRIETCLKENTMCKKDMYQNLLSPQQTGCCMPPAHCGYVYTNETYWTLPPSRPMGTTDPDCVMWSNDQQFLCYRCNSCKASVLEGVQRGWKDMTMYSVAFLVFVIIVCSIGCCALRNNKSDMYQKYQGYRY